MHPPPAAVFPCNSRSQEPVVPTEQREKERAADHAASARRNFWVQPCEGLNEDTRGRSEAELNAWEQSTGKTLPPLLRWHLQAQNGGYPRYPVYCDAQGEKHWLFINSEALCGLRDMACTVCATLEAFMDPEEIDALGKASGLQLDRLHMLSWLDGHSCLCLDYGARQEATATSPQVVLFEMESALLAEIVRAPSYADFVDGLRYGGTNTEYYVGVDSALSLEELARYFDEKLQCRFEKDTSDYYGWFNFDAWYIGSQGSGYDYHIFILSPNRHRAGTFLFPDDADIPHIFCVRYNEVEELDNATASVREWLEKLQSPEVRCTLLLEPACIPEM